MHSPALNEQSLLSGGAAGHLTHHPAPPVLVYRASADTGLSLRLWGKRYIASSLPARHGVHHFVSKSGCVHAFTSMCVTTCCIYAKFLVRKSGAKTKSAGMVQRAARPVVGRRHPGKDLWEKVGFELPLEGRKDSGTLFNHTRSLWIHSETSLCLMLFFFQVPQGHHLSHIH